jgi:hypothetical protein
MQDPAARPRENEPSEDVTVAALRQPVARLNSFKE